MSRRLRQIGRAAAAAVSVGALMAACSSPTPATSPISTTSPAPTASSPSTANSASTAASTVPPTSTAAAATTTTVPLPPPVPVWADEFDGAAGAPPDPSRWAFDLGGTGWGNRQLEYYTDTNARTDGDGHLLITSQSLDVTTAPSCWYGACHFASSRLTTAGLASWTYGRFEIRAAMPSGEATWPAFWMLGGNFAEVGWPAAGEIDVVEHVGREGNVVRGTAHGPGYSAGEGVTGSVDVGDHEEFHVYAVEWGPTSIVWFVDGVEYHRLDESDERTWVFDHDFYLVLDLAIGGLLGGEPGAVDFEPKTFSIDYVRVYAV